MVFDGENWKIFKPEDGLAHEVVYDIEQAPDGAMWFATQLGASSYHEGVWKNYTMKEGLGFDDVRGIEIAPDGAVWFMHFHGGVTRFGPP